MKTQDAPIAVSKTRGGFLVKLPGPIHTNVELIEREFQRVVKAKPTLVEVDMSGCTYLCSPGFATLVGFYNQITANDGTMKIIAVRNRVFGALQHTRLDQLFKISPDVVLPD